MTSAVYLNNIPNLGDVSHAIKIICFDTKHYLEFLSSIDNSGDFDNLYFIENFTDFKNYKDGINLYNFLKSSNKNIFIFISEDPNYYNDRFKKYFLLNNLCSFKHLIILIFLRNVNVVIFFLLYKYIFLVHNYFYEKIFSKLIFFIIKLFRIDFEILRWIFRSAIYSRILSYQKQVIIPNKRTLGPNRILESTFNLNVINAKISKFDVDGPVDPYDYRESISKSNFSNLVFYVFIGKSTEISDYLFRLCYFYNLTRSSYLYMLIESLSYFSESSGFFKNHDIFSSRTLNSVEVIIVENDYLCTSDNVITYFRNYFNFHNLAHLNLNFSIIKCP